MILGSHNSWSYIRPKKWWMKLLALTAKCQSKTIIEQYEDYGVRCFDLRLRYFNGAAHVVHNVFDYGFFWGDRNEVLYWLNSKKDVVIRVIHDVRTKKDYTPISIKCFKEDCQKLEEMFPDIKFWCGKNAYNDRIDYEFEYKPKCVERYSSVCPPKTIDDWLPFIYANIKNKRTYKENTIDKNDNTILLIDFVNIR